MTVTQGASSSRHLLDRDPNTEHVLRRQPGIEIDAVPLGQRTERIARNVDLRLPLGHLRGMLARGERLLAHNGFHD